MSKIFQLSTLFLLSFSTPIIFPELDLPFQQEVN